jgi:hypothetical protein
VRPDVHDIAVGGLVHPDLPGLRAGPESREGTVVMARRIVHEWARTRERVPTGYRKALCGLLVPRRDARKSGVSCTLCQTVKANTTLSAMGLGESQADQANRGHHSRGGGR